ncbi:hypothetical protein B0H63DRAFT_506081 [Podospora didyma]|uniref:F-box domain-containing protein n=1 Tax=Podospora didyma TaxID=330526 RepID=A0AAE0P6R9_9PEZI|nr:hypothetical protein B0H63DRAFT_506081 [Podospora didyma]
MADESNPELESFREQWKAEVRAKIPGAAASSSAAAAAPIRNSVRTLDSTRKTVPAQKEKAVAAAVEEEDDYVKLPTFDEAPQAGGVTLSSQTSAAPPTGPKEPVSALDHYEKAVEREAAGSLGDSLRLYRKAYRMDDRVDQAYQNKHFPKPATVDSANSALASASARPGTSLSAPAGPAKSEKQEPQSMKDLIASFCQMTIEPAAPTIEGMPAPPCPIASLPTEILVHIIHDVAVIDIGDFVRLAQVCKRFAYLVATENAIWRRVCLGTEFGFGGMHYHWQKQTSGGPLTVDDLLREAEAEANEQTDEPEKEAAITAPLTLEQRARRHAEESAANTLVFYRSLYSSSWQRMFRLRPRVRFNGAYISTVNYIRSGQASANQSTWGTPVHIVTYFRYLRFFRDGTALSLCTTAEPADVVHHLTREAAALHRDRAAPHLPSAVMHSALRGRWRLASAADNPTASISEVEGDLVVETEGVSTYIYRLDLSLRSAGKNGARNNKLVWRNFNTYNTLTDDWAVFEQKNYKPFFFSRVKSYGVKGE